jgi:hypothetical protein
MGGEGPVSVVDETTPALRAVVCGASGAHLPPLVPRRLCLAAGGRNLINVRFAPKATEVLRCRERPCRNRARDHLDEVAPSHAARSGAHDHANHIQSSAVTPSRTGGLTRYNGMRPFLRPVKSARLCVAALEAGLAEILAWERAASVPSAGIALQ